MPELVRLILDLLKDLCPIQTVKPWQRGLYTFLGRHVGTVGPGPWPVIPFACEVYRVSMATAAGTTPLQSVTLKDGRVLSFSATLTYRVVDPRLAFYEVERYAETVVEIAAGVITDILGAADPERFDPARKKRANLLEEVREELDSKCRAKGVAVDELRFPNFAFVRTVRLLLDKAVLTEGNHLAG